MMLTQMIFWGSQRFALNLIGQFDSDSFPSLKIAKQAQQIQCCKWFFTAKTGMVLGIVLYH